METRESMLEQSNLSALTRSPLAASTARKAPNRYRQCLDDIHGIRNKLFTSAEISAVNQESTSFAESVTSTDADESINSFLDQSKRRMSSFVSDTVRRSVIKGIPSTNARVGTAKDHVEEIEVAKSQSSRMGCMDAMPETPDRNPLADTTAVDLSQIFKAPDRQDAKVLQCLQVSFQPQQISGRSTSVSNKSYCKSGASLGEFSGLQNVSFPDEEFFSSGLAEGKLKEDEEQFEKDHMFDGRPCKIQHDSLQESIGPQDVTRPSWVPGDRDRVSIGSYLMGRSAPINEILLPSDCNREENDSNEHSKPHKVVQELVQNLGFDKNTCDESVPNRPTTVMGKPGCPPLCASKPVSGFPDQSPGNGSAVGSLSLSMINRLLDDTSVTEEPGSVLQKLLGATKTEVLGGKRNGKAQAFNLAPNVTKDGNSVFKRPFPVAPHGKSLSSVHARRLASCASNLQPARNESSKQSGVTKDTSQSMRALPGTCEKNFDAAIDDLTSSFVNGDNRTYQWVMKATPGPGTLGDAPQMPRLPEASSSHMRTGTSLHDPHRVSVLDSAVRDTCGSEDHVSVISDSSTALSKEQGSQDSTSTSGSNTGSFPWTQNNMGVLKAEQYHNRIPPSCSSVSSGGEGGPAITIVPERCSQQIDLDLGSVCVGVLKKAVLTFVNPSESMVCYLLKWSESQFSDEGIDCTGFVDISFPEVITVNPLQSKEVKGTFLSRRPGEVKTTVEVQQMQMTSEPIHITLCAVVEWPHLRVEIPKPQEFRGIELNGPDCVGTITVTNKSSCTVPFKIMIIEGQGSFLLTKKDCGKYSVPRHSNAVPVFSSLSAGETSEFTVIFSPRKAKTLCCNAKVQILLNGHYASTELLESIPISASVVAPKLKAEVLSEVLCVSDTEEKIITLKNRGRSGLQVEFFSTSDAFAVAPKQAFIEPASTLEITVVLVNTSEAACGTPMGTLQAVVQPQGIVLDILKLEGKLDDVMNGAVQPSHAHQHTGNKRFILQSNKRLLLWTNVPVGQNVTKNIVFRNPSEIPIRANVMIHEHHVSCFKVFVKGEGSPSHMVSIHLQPEKSIEISVRFCPSSVSFVHSRLLIHGQGPNMVNNSVPLFAFGGRVQVNLLGVSTIGQSGYIVDLGLIPECQTVSREFTVFNGGDWDCFVLFTFTKESSSLSSTEEAKVSPQCLVLESKESRTVSLSVKASCTRSSAGCDDQIVKLGTLKVLHGLEVLRKWARRAWSHSNVKPENIVPFLRQFEGERNVDDISLPTSALRETFLKTVSQTAVILTSGAGTIMMQASTNMSFVPLEDL